MKSKWDVAVAAIYLVFGVSAIFSFVVLAWSGEHMVRWIPAFLLAIFLAVMGVRSIIRFFFNR